MNKIKNNLKLIIITGLILGCLSVLALLTYDNQSDQSKQPEQTTSLTQPIDDKPADPLPPQIETPPRSILPDYRLIALYGSPGAPVLGMLGEQSPEESVKRVKELASQYQPYSSEEIKPAFEIITTIASAGPTVNGDYSNELDPGVIKPWIDIAKQNDIYVILDLQPGLSDFVTQAKLYEDLLSEPHVGLALDPEWRLKPGQKHMKSIGSVSADEINATADWLNELCVRKDLPKKLFLIHQFKLSMIENQERLNPVQPSLAWLIQMDGLGAQPTKLQTWNTITNKAPTGVYLGWKNFFDEDKPMLSPEQTMQIQPQPFYVSYQ